MTQRDWQGRLLRIAVILGTLLVVLVAIALLWIVVQILLRFGNVLVLFVLGALVAYVLNPLVSWVTARTGKRWVGAMTVYVGLATVLGLVAIAVVQPLVNESSSLIKALRNPTASSVRSVGYIASRSQSAQQELRGQLIDANAGSTIPTSRVQKVRVIIADIESELIGLGAPPAQKVNQTPAKQASNAPQTQLQVPPSYLEPLRRSTGELASDYGQAMRDRAAPDAAALTRSVADAGRITSQAKALHKTLSGTPILLLDAQTWVDQHHIDVNVTKSAGQAVKQISSQISSVLNNTASILSQTATLLLDLFLILIISVYFVLDGQRMVREAIAHVPSAYQRQAIFFTTSLDSVLGSYIRAQLVLAAAAGALAGLGAAVLGVPFALIIGVSVSILQLLPVIGPILVYVVPMIIAVLFTSMPTPLILLGYLIVMEQIVTNVIGPRVNSKSVGIHPLEAMAAALLGYPIAGVLGSFLAVPIVGFLHVLVKQAYTSRRAGRSSSDGTSSGGAASTTDEFQVPSAEEETPVAVVPSSS